MHILAFSSSLIFYVATLRKGAFRFAFVYLSIRKILILWQGGKVEVSMSYGHISSCQELWPFNDFNLFSSFPGLLILYNLQDWSVPEVLAQNEPFIWLNNFWLLSYGPWIEKASCFGALQKYNVQHLHLVDTYFLCTTENNQTYYFLSSLVLIYYSFLCQLFVIALFCTLGLQTKMKYFLYLAGTESD